MQLKRFLISLLARKKRAVKNKKSCENTEQYSTRMRDICYKVTTARVIAFHASDSDSLNGFFFQNSQKRFCKASKTLFSFL